MQHILHTALRHSVHVCYGDNAYRIEIVSTALFRLQHQPAAAAALNPESHVFGITITIPSEIKATIYLPTHVFQCNMFDSS